MTTRPTLPQNYETIPITVCENFETVGDWTRTGHAEGTIEESSISLVGVKSLKMACSVNGTTNWSYETTNAYKAIDIDLSNGPGIWSILVYCASFGAAYPVMRVILSRSVGGVSGANYATAVVSILQLGWNIIQLPAWTPASGFAWSGNAKTLWLSLYNAGGGACEVYVDALYRNICASPRCVLTFDDTHESHHSQAFAYMATKDIRGTCFINNNVGVSGKMTLANLQEMYAAGWCVTNHGASHINYADASGAEMLADFSVMQNLLQTYGFVRGNNIFSYPFGTNDADAQTFLAANGVTMARCTYPSLMPFPIIYNMPMGTAGSSMFTIPSYSMNSSTSNTTAMGYVRNAIASGQSVWLHFHRIMETPSEATDISITQFQALIDEICASRIPVVTADEWYNGLTNPRYRSLPVARV